MAEKAGVCVLIGKSGPIGTIEFSDAGAAGVRIKGTLTGLTPGQHGFHIHQFGDTTNGCASTGGHYNPKGVNHGAPSDAVRAARVKFPCDPDRAPV
jgi:Cu-Zn family superoxide dismutase